MSDEDWFAHINEDDEDTTPQPKVSSKKKSPRPGRKRKKEQPATLNIDELLIGDSGLNANVTQDIISNPGKSRNFEKLEENLREYIARMIDKVRDEFKAELQNWIQNTTEEDAVISSFISEIREDLERVAADEIELGKSASEQQRQSGKMEREVNVKLEELSNVIPRREQQTDATIESLANDIVKARVHMSGVVPQLLKDIKKERSALVCAREQLVASYQNGANRNMLNTLKMEVEANQKRVEIEEEFCQTKKARMEVLQKEWNDRQLENEKDGTDKNVLKRLAELATIAPNSRLQAAIARLKGLSDAAERNCEDIRNIRNQLEIEFARLHPPKDYKKQVKQENISGQVKDSIRKRK